MLLPSRKDTILFILFTISAIMLMSDSDNLTTFFIVHMIGLVILFITIFYLYKGRR